jgi:hypothetical protein
MYMSDLGKSVFNAVEFLTEFYKDVSRLVTTVEDRVSSEGLVSLYGSRAIWNRSISYHSPTLWMPKWVATLYSVKEDEGSGREERAPWCAFFVVYFTPKKIGEPVAIWGIGTQTASKNLGAKLSELVAVDDGPGFLTEVSVTEWELVDEVPEVLSSLQYQARLAVELKDAQIVDEVVVVPLVEEMCQLGAPLRLPRGG